MKREERREQAMMMVALLVVAVLMVISTVQATGCTKEEYLAKFGSAYELNVKGAAVEPGLEGQFFVGEVSYTTSCPNGGSKFTSMFKKGGDMPFSVLIASRQEPECAESEKVEPYKFKGVVSIDLTANGKESAFTAFEAQRFRFIAFPPDGEFETYDLRSRESTIDKTLSVTSTEPTSTESELNVRTSSNETADQEDSDTGATATIAHVMEIAESEL